MEVMGESLLLEMGASCDAHGVHDASGSVL